jgi:hypothetical protein
MPTSEYMKEWRKTDVGQEALRKQKARQRAHGKAVKLLIQRYPLEWASLFRKALEAEGES